MDSSKLTIRYLDMTGSALKPRQPHTFWKSPYREKSANNGVNSRTLNSQSLSIRPLFGITQDYDSDHAHKTNQQHPVKSILKNKSTVDRDTYDEYIRRPNLITTGTGRGFPHGATQRPKTTGKRVQFNRVPNQTQAPNSSMESLTYQYKLTPCKGRRLYLDNSVSARILGSSYRAQTAFPSRPGATSINGSSNGGDLNMRSEISDFIRKLRLAETEKGTRNNSLCDKHPLEHEITLPDVRQQKTAAKLRLSRIHRSRPHRPDWREYDLDRVAENDQGHEAEGFTADQQLSDHEDSDMFPGTKSVAESDSISIDSFDSLDEKPAETSEVQGVSRGKFHTTPNASLYTKYRHITSNVMHKYDDKVSVIPVKKKRNLKSKGDNLTNFCDSGKTHQILGWLEEVNSANVPLARTGQKNMAAET